MTTTGPISPTTAVNDQTAGSNAWTTPGNVVSPDDGTSVILDSYYLLLGGFEDDEDVAAIPDDATLDGLLLELNPDVDSGDEIDIVQAKHGGSYVGDNKGPVEVSGSSHSSGTDYQVSVGGSSDDWGLNLTGADVKDGTFGIGLRVTDTGGSVPKVLKHARVTFYHSSTGGPSWFVAGEVYHPGFQAGEVI